MSKENYLEYQSSKDREYLEACKAAGIEPLLYHDASSPAKADTKDPAENAPAPGGKMGDQDFCFFDEKPADSCPKDCRAEQADAVLKVLYLLAGQQHPGLRLATDCLLAIINRSEHKSQAEIARRYGLTRAAVSKRMRDIRLGRTLAGALDCFFFGGHPEASAKARERAIRVHSRSKQSQQKHQCKPTIQQQLSKLAA